MVPEDLGAQGLEVLKVVLKVAKEDLEDPKEVPVALMAVPTAALVVLEGLEVLKEAPAVPVALVAMEVLEVLKEAPAVPVALVAMEVLEAPKEVTAVLTAVLKAVLVAPVVVGKGTQLERLGTNADMRLGIGMG
ncbi:hypothetical protein N7533_002256 [Penicillium manginii]|uniref:uncharacterized protein n=1 Tax=Penicillium manginii TaxID=203109 RepID=UPI00254808C0|nr:uncharacterized protein N7533_002256 [Penicillium manginii]KAJ5763575.1 hypothetical protein N7533_002256 [Penicillium manginii]